ncbi:membrane protein [Citrobacter freundii]|nr:membrane protein [Citrobacter freundii]
MAKKIGSLITTLYFIAFFVVVLIYRRGNNQFHSLNNWQNIIAIDLRVRMLVSLGVVLVLNLIFLMGRQATIRVMGFLVFPLIAYFFVPFALPDRKLAANATHRPDVFRSAHTSSGLDIYSRDGFRF